MARLVSALSFLFCTLQTVLESRVPFVAATPSSAVGRSHHVCGGEKREGVRVEPSLSSSQHPLPFDSLFEPHKPTTRCVFLGATNFHLFKDATESIAQTATGSPNTVYRREECLPSLRFPNPALLQSD